MPRERNCACASAAKYAVLTSPMRFPRRRRRKLKLLFWEVSGQRNDGANRQLITDVRVIAVVGEDFGKRQEAVFQARSIDIS
jgi:hypothetical protein